MAVVWRAHDRMLDVERAIKILQPAMAARAKVRQRFDNEARTMAKLTHPNIVTVHDVGVDGDRPYIVMELVEGGSAMGWVERHGPMPAKLAVDLMIPVLQALHAAHQKSVVHRDVKPHNILINGQGIAKVTDFGIAQIRDTDQAMTRTGVVMGTLAYMAPEQKQSAKTVDARSDVYAASATLYALLTGNEPFDLYTTEMQEDVGSQLPDRLADVIRKGTRYRPEHRFESALAMIQALEAAIPSLPVPPRSTPPLGEIVLQTHTHGRPSTLHDSFDRYNSGHEEPESNATVPLPPSRDFKPTPSHPSPSQPGTTNPGLTAVGVSLPGNEDLHRPPSPWQVAARPSSDTDIIAIPDAPEDPNTPSAPTQRFVAAPAVLPAPAEVPSRANWAIIGGLFVLAVVIAAVAYMARQPNGVQTALPAVVPVAAPVDVPPAPVAVAPAVDVPVPAEVPAVVPVVAAPTPTATPSAAAVPTAAPKPSVVAPVAVVANPEPTPVAPDPTPVEAVVAPVEAVVVAPEPTPTVTAPVPVTEVAPSTPSRIPVYLNTLPWSFIVIDGAPAGRTGFQGSLPTGKHSLTFTAADGRSVTRTIDVAGQEFRFCYDFAKDGPC